MGNYRSYWRCGLVATALFALGPAQMNSTPHRDSAHAPMIRVYNPDGTPKRGPRNQSVSGNWSGYALSTGSTGDYTSASFSWTIQTATYINYGGSNPYSFDDSSQWVGIGGFSTNDLIQLGTDSYIDSSGASTYYAWSEVLPADTSPLSGCTPAGKSSCPVSPGDAMTASLNCTANCTANNPNTTWTMSMTDSTQGWSWSGNFTYASCLCSADWIEEAPFYGEVAAIANFGEAPFANLTVNGANPGLSLEDGILLEDFEGGHATPCQAFDGDQVGDGNQFIVAYGLACISTFDSHDFNDDTKSDIAWRNSNGDVSIWLMDGSTISSHPVVANVPAAWTIVGQRDFNGDGKSDVLWRNSDGDVMIWFMNGTTVTSSQVIATVPLSSKIVGTGDFNGDGRGDILWRNSDGEVSIWLMNGATIISRTDVGSLPAAWTVAGIGDFNGDGMSDILWRNSDGEVMIWFMNGTTVTSSPVISTVPLSWKIVGTGDFNGDGNSDILWRNDDGDVRIWLMNGATITSSQDLRNVPATWSVVATGDYNGDGMSDILWRNSYGDLLVWFMNGTTIQSSHNFGIVPMGWTVQGASAD